jgi:hypothetical protein
MAVLLSLSQNNDLVGGYTNRTLLWNAIAQLEGLEECSVKIPIDSLLIVDESGKMHGSFASRIDGEIINLKFTTLTYAHLCSACRDQRRIALHSADDFTPAYGIWCGIINETHIKETNEVEND